MKIKNELSVALGRKRWMKRLFGSLINETAFKEICSGIKFHYCPKDMEGPSFHFGYDLEKGFLNYEEEDKKQLMALIPPNGVFYDIGANIGMFTVYIAKYRPDVEVLSFEPEKKVFSCLKQTVEKSHLSNVKCFNVGIACEDSNNASLYLSPENDGGHSLKIDHGDESSPRAIQHVKLVNLEKFRKENQLKYPNVIKIDVEGFEAEVLKGIIDIVSVSKPIILVECKTEDFLNLESDLNTNIKKLFSLGAICSVKGKDLSSIEEIKVFCKDLIKVNKRHENYLFKFKD